MPAPVPRTVDDALRRIAATEPRLHAWTHLDPHAASAARTAPDGPLHALPFGVKDIYDVAGLPTECGSPLREGRVAERDSALVARLREAGAVPLGKTVTTEFAYFAPGPTRNPHGPEHTPGGSSSGSAAAVAAGHVPFALGSQTAGSLTRPTAYCGTAGYVPPVGAWPTDGIQGLSPTLDAPGLLAPDVDALLPLVEALDGTRPEGEPELGIWQATELADVDPEMTAVLTATAERLGAEATPVRGLDTGYLAELHACVMAYEAARSLATEARTPHALSAPLRELLTRGAATPEGDYRLALDTRADLRSRALARLDSTVVLAPAAPGAAPRGLAATGSPVLSRPWQFLGLPTITVPGHRDRNGMPLGLQLIGHPGQLPALFAAARRVRTATRALTGTTPRPETTA
ncbi:amidase [Streptomyces sp. NPDC000151]|uniref:amidase n=1 Tax=Streptomyces sp. NPDC000151 TaxID=3154244 RepID=UPI003320DD05